MKKLTNNETKEYIKLQLPIVKGELQQANNRINTIITVLGIFITFFTVLTTFFAMKWGELTYQILTILFAIFSLVFIVALVYIISALRPKKKVKSSPKETECDIYNFFEISQVSKETFFSYFTYDENEKLALNQIYINSILAYERYSKVGKVMLISLK